MPGPSRTRYPYCVVRTAPPPAEVLAYLQTRELPDGLRYVLAGEGNVLTIEARSSARDLRAAQIEQKAAALVKRLRPRKRGS